MNEAKVVTVRQPFASLIAVGAKTLLDQTRPTGYRGRLLIHSGRTKPDMAWEGGGLAIAGEWTQAGGDQLFAYGTYLQNRLDLPLGVVVASCELLDCVPIIDDVTGPRCIEPHYSVGQGADGWLFPAPMPDRGWYADEDVPVDRSDQLEFGDFAPGRFVWLLDDVRPTTERCPRCWGPGAVHGDDWQCSVCDGAGVCPPVRMRGGPGLRTPEW